MKLSIVIVTLGRRDVLTQTLADLQRQTRLPDELVISAARAQDVPVESLDRLGFPVRTIMSPIGCTSQRNTGLDAVQSADLIVFLDDDFLMASDFLARAEQLFTDHPDIAVATGVVLADGIHGPGLGFSPSQRQLLTLAPAGAEVLTDVYNAYGCNMLVRGSFLWDNDIRFDERLPLYGWLEDVDFSRRMAPFGRIVRSNALRGIHLGNKKGRSSGHRLGYSQIANPLYLRSKHSMIARRAFAIMARNLTANLVNSLRPEPEIDRRGRLRGNLRAIKDLLMGSLRPEKVMDFK